MSGPNAKVPFETGSICLLSHHMVGQWPCYNEVHPGMLSVHVINTYHDISVQFVTHGPYTHDTASCACTWRFSAGRELLLTHFEHFHGTKC